MRPNERVRRAPLVTFAGVQVVALFTWLIVGRSDWFYIDEWDFLAGRKATNLHDLFRPHNGHWTTLPLIVFRALYATFGLRAYLPYRLVVIVLYLIAASLLLAFMRRTGINPWIATSAASFFLLFGAGWENIILPFQITFMGSFTLGLVYLLLADQDGDLNRRDLLGMLAGLGALMCSAVGLVMVAVVVATVWMRRDWQLALRHLVPSAAFYTTWYVAIGHRDGGVGRVDLGAVAGFVSTGLRAAFGALGPAPIFGVVFAGVLVVGLALARNQRGGTERKKLAAPAALLTGALMLVVLTAFNSWSFGEDWARESRYVSILGGMSLPALAVAADALAHRWRQLLPFAIALFLVGIPANIHSAEEKQTLLRTRDAATRSTMLSLPHEPLARSVPRDVRPEPTTAPDVTIGWLLDLERHGRLPAPPPLTPDQEASNQFRLSFVTRPGKTPTADCRTGRRSIVIDLRKGDRIGLRDEAVFLQPAFVPLIGLRLFYAPIAGHPITVLRDLGPTRLEPYADNPLRFCLDRA